MSEIPPKPLTTTITADGYIYNREECNRFRKRIEQSIRNNKPDVDIVHTSAIPYNANIREGIPILTMDRYDEDGEPILFSALNGLVRDNKRYSFFGLSMYAKTAPVNVKKEKFSASVNGIFLLINTSDTRLEVGDFIGFRLPEPDEISAVNSKIIHALSFDGENTSSTAYPVIVNYNIQFDDIEEQSESELIEENMAEIAAIGADINSGEYRQAVQKMKSLVGKYSYKVKDTLVKGYIGRALQSAEPGQWFSVKI